MEKSMPNTLSSTQCSSCAIHPAERERTAKVTLSGNRRRSFRKVEEDRTPLSVPAVDHARACRRWSVFVVGSPGRIWRKGIAPYHCLPSPESERMFV